ncbi:hypothetical protein SAMN05518856_102305 [Paenibacillus sp. OK003]|nr:hypothetical protein SAMN05518856_102305 [Paenibacillus sp. OK003]
MEYRFEQGYFLIYSSARSTSSGDIMVVKLLDRPFKDRFEFLVNSKNYECTTHTEFNLCLWALTNMRSLIRVKFEVSIF